jgi:hypothetical protein
VGPNKSGDFPRIDFGDPPSKSEKTHTGLLKPTIDEGAGSFVSGGPHERRGKLFNTGLLLPTFEEGTVCFMSGGPYGPR